LLGYQLVLQIKIVRNQLLHQLVIMYF